VYIFVFMTLYTTYQLRDTLMDPWNVCINVSMTVRPVWLFFIVPWHYAFKVRCSGIFCMILRWFHLLLLLLVYINTRLNSNTFHYLSVFGCCIF